MYGGGFKGCSFGRIIEQADPDRKPRNRKTRSGAIMAESPDVSYRRNIGSVSFTYRDAGSQGLFMNVCRLQAWRLALLRHGMTGERVIDVGCSNGSWADNWNELGFGRVEGIEGNPEAAAQAAARLDIVHEGFLDDVVDRVEPAKVVAANGVVVHILERQAYAEFLSDAGRLVDHGGFLLVSVLNAEYYVTPGGREPWTGPNSCTRSLDHHRECFRAAGLEIVDEIGTFVNP